MEYVMEYLKGKTLVYFAVEERAVEFITETGERFVLESADGPPNDCHVWVESVVGDITDLLNTLSCVGRKCSRRYHRFIEYTLTYG